MGNEVPDPSKQWKNKDFTEAVISSGVGWMIIQWEIKYEPSTSRNCQDCHDYTMFPNQFNDIPKNTPYNDVLAIFNAHVANRELLNATLDRDTDPVRITLFLCKVDRVVNITDDDGNVKVPVEEIENADKEGQK